MRRSPSCFHLPPYKTPSRVTALGLLVLAVAFVALVAVALHAFPRTAAQQAQQSGWPKLWPSFTMVYTLKSTDPATGKVVVDQTHKVVVTDEHNWRDDITQDNVDSKEVGSYSQVSGAVLHEYSAARNYSQDLPLGSPNALTGITADLDPTLFFSISKGLAHPLGKGWADTTPSAAGRVAKMHTETHPCASGGGTCQEERLVEFDASSINNSPTAGQQTPIGGIAVFGQRIVNGNVVYTFSATSLQVGS